MKKTLLFLVLTVLGAAGAVLAGPPPPPANVRFISERDVPFAVLLDGRPLGRGLTRQARAECLAPGLHYAEFSVPTRFGPVRLRSRVWLEPGLETRFVLRARPGRPLDLRPAGSVALYGYGYGGYGSNGTYGAGRPDQDGCDDDDRDDDDRAGYDDRDGRGPGSGRPDKGRPQPGGYGSGRYGSGGYDEGRGGAGYGQPGYGPNGGGRYGPPPVGAGYGQPLLLAPAEVAGLTQALDRCSFEDERLQIARQALSQSRIRAQDLARLLGGFRFDGSRVEFAKFAYPRVADRQNFYLVYPVFEFSSHAREVQQAVAAMEAE